MKRHFDPKYMEKRKPMMPKAYQRKFILRLLGVASPVQRMMNYDLEYEIRFIKWLCYKRRLSKEDWRRLRILLKVKKEKKDKCGNI